MMMKSRLAGALFALCAVSAVASAADWKGEEVQKEGVTHVMNPAAPMNAPATVEPQELWRIGGYDDDEIFGVITSIVQDEASGEILMLDAQLNEIKVYSEEGEFLRTIGREGEGPGEFRFAFSHFQAPGGNIGVLQAFPPKIVLLTPEGDPAGEYPLPEHEGEGFQIIITAQNAGDNLAIMQLFNQQIDEGTGFEMKEALTLCPKGDSASNILRTFTTRLQFSKPVIVEKEWSGMRNGRWAAFRDGRVAAATSFDDYTINMYTADGSLDRVIHREYVTHERSKDEQDWVRDVFERSTAQQMPIPNKEFKISETHAPVASMRSREDGTLWVQSSRGQFDKPDDSIGVFDVYDAKGRFAQQLTLAGNADERNDISLFVGEYMFVITDFMPSIVALQGGGSGEEESDEEIEPMQIICYRLDAPKVGMN